MATRTDPVRACTNCEAVIGQATNDLGVTTRDDDGSGVGKPEHWCSQCFVWVRAPKSPARWYWPAMVALCCSRCEKRTVSFTGPICGQCNSKAVLVLPAKVVDTSLQHAPMLEIDKAASRAT